MTQFVSQTQLINIKAENEVKEIISRFDSNLILSIMTENLENIHNNYSMTSGNLVASFEENFKEILERYKEDPDEVEEINQARLNVYIAIIDIFCKHYNLTVNPNTPSNLYHSVAYYMYDFLLCNYHKYIISFFTKFIVKEKNSLYEQCKMDQYRKNKDSSTLYGKKLYKDIKIAIINANLIPVLESISNLDISFNSLLNYTYQNQDKHLNDFLNNTIIANDNFFKTHYCKDVLLPNIITEIRLEIQKANIIINQSKI